MHDPMPDAARLRRPWWLADPGDEAGQRLLVPEPAGSSRPGVLVEDARPRSSPHGEAAAAAAEALEKAAADTARLRRRSGLEELELQARRAGVEHEEDRSSWLRPPGWRACRRCASATSEATAQEASRVISRIGPARQDDRHAGAQHDAGGIRVGQEGQALGEHVAGLEIGHDEHVGLSGDRRSDLLDPGRAEVDRVVERQRSVEDRRR